MHASAIGRLLRRAAPALVALVGVSALAGCAPAGPTPAEARIDFYRDLDDTEDLLGGTWENLDDPTPRGCLAGWWSEGVQYPALRIGPAPASMDRALTTVTDAWSQWGLRVERTPVGDAVELQGRRSDALLVFRVSDQGMTLHGHSECRPE